MLYRFLLDIVPQCNTLLFVIYAHSLGISKPNAHNISSLLTVTVGCICTAQLMTVVTSRYLYATGQCFMVITYIRHYHQNSKISE